MMRTRAKKKHVASDRTRRENVPRHILFGKVPFCIWFYEKRNDETWGWISKSIAVYRLPLRCDRATARKGLEFKGNTKQIRWNAGYSNK